MLVPKAQPKPTRRQTRSAHIPNRTAKVHWPTQSATSKRRPIAFRTQRRLPKAQTPQRRKISSWNTARLSTRQANPHNDHSHPPQQTHALPPRPSARQQQTLFSSSLSRSFRLVRDGRRKHHPRIHVLIPFIVPVLPRAELQAPWIVFHFVRAATRRISKIEID